MSDECKKILAYAAEEADNLSHKFIGTDHLLLGILREQGCFAAKLLRDKGVSPESARNQLSTQAPEELGTLPKSSGIPSGYTSHRLLYNPASEMLIVELRRAGAAHLLPTPLFMRHRDSDAYEPIGNPLETVSYESPVTCHSQPLVVFNSLRWEHGGGSWEGVYSFDLKSKHIVLRLENLTLDEPHRRLWITKLVSLSEDGEKVYVTAGVEKAIASGTVAHYFLATVNLSEGKLLLLAPLKDIRILSERIFILIGAGVSAESGIPTFRGVRGLWCRLA